MQQRLKKNPYLALFDGADPSSSTGVRLPSTTPLQALFAMNDPLAHSQSTWFAQRILASGSDDQLRVTAAYQLAFSRPPLPEEQQECQGFLTTYRKRLGDLKVPADQVEIKAWSALARSLMGSNEFIYVD